MSAYNLSFRLDQLPRSLVCIVWATADGQKFQNSTKNSKQIKVICHFSRLTERLSSAETISRFWIISSTIGIFDNSFQIFSVLEPGFRLWRGRWVYWRTNWFRDRYEKSSSNTVFDTVAKLLSANCQIAESIVLQNSWKHDQLQSVQGAGGVAWTAWSCCQSGHGGGQAQQGC